MSVATSLQAHLRSRRRVSPDDLPSRNVRCSSIFKTLSLVKQPHIFSLHLRLLPDIDFHNSKHSYGFTTSHLGTFQFLTSITLLFDEPRTNYSNGGVDDAVSRGVLSACIEAVRQPLMTTKNMYSVQQSGCELRQRTEMSRCFSHSM